MGSDAISSPGHGESRGQEAENAKSQLPTRESLDQALSILDGSSGQHFQGELLDAIYEIPPSDELKAVARVIRAWHKSASFQTQPGFRAKLERSQEHLSALTGE